MYNVDPQQQQQQSGNVFMAIDQLRASVPLMTRWVLAVIGGISGFFYANMHGAEDYTVWLVVAGFFGGLLTIDIAWIALKALTAAMILAAIALLVFWLFNYQAAHHHPRPPSPQTAIRRQI